MGSVILLVILILMSAFFSATETAFSSLNRIRLKNKAREGSKRAHATLKLAEKYDNLLSTILIGNNIVNIASASLATSMFINLMSDYSVSIATTVSSVVMTVLVLIFGEISPKSMAKEAPEQFAMFVTPIVKIFVIILFPINWLFAQWKKLLVLIIRPKRKAAISEAELITIVDEAESEGGIDKEDSELIRSAIEFSELLIEEIAVPRVDVVAIDVKSTMEDVYAVYAGCSFTRLPVYDNTIDNIVGILHSKDFYTAYIEKKGDLRSIVSEAYYTTEQAQAADVLKELQKRGSHMAIVIDEYGGTHGIVTLEDILEELVGEIWDEHDTKIEYVTESDGVFTVDCKMDVEDMFERLNLTYDDDIDFSTVSGFLISLAGGEPNVGDKINYHNYEFTIKSMANHRIDSVLVKKIDYISVSEDI